MKMLSIIFILACLIFLQCSKNTCTSCDLQPKVGTCKALIPKYYFDKKDQKCKEFFWGGCDGVVPFETREACEFCACK